MLACDFFPVDCAVTLQRISVFFMMEVSSRYPHLVGVTTNPDALDRAPGPGSSDESRRSRRTVPVSGPRPGRQFTASFDAVLTNAGITAVMIPPPSPRANAYAERFVLTVRTEVTDRMLIFGERLRTVLTEDARYDNQRPAPPAPTPPTPARPPDHRYPNGTDHTPIRPRRPDQ
jgi:putative transposase